MEEKVTFNIRTDKKKLEVKGSALKYSGSVIEHPVYTQRSHFMIHRMFRSKFHLVYEISPLKCFCNTMMGYLVLPFTFLFEMSRH